MDIGNKIYNLRVSRKISRKDFAKRVNVDPGTVSRWERGLQKLNIVNIIPVAKALGIDPNYLIGWKEV